MSSQLVRLDALVFRADSVRFEACVTFRAAASAGDGDAELCECGWLEADHAGPPVNAVVSRRQFQARRPRRRQPVAARQTA